MFTFRRHQKRSSLGVFPTDDEAKVLAHLLDALSKDGTLVSPAQIEEARVSSRDPASPEAIRTILRRMTELVWLADRVELLDRFGITHPAYDTHRDYPANCNTDLGPSLPSRPRTARTWVVLGKEIDFPIGVAASVLAPNARRVQYWASQGYNLIVYKTVRNVHRNANDDPNWLVVDGVWQGAGRAVLPITDPLTGPLSEPVQASPLEWVEPGTNMSTVNSYGVPSSDWEIWKDDVRLACAAVAADQLLIVSFVGDYEKLHTLDELASDFALCARRLIDAGAYAIEPNLSCPNFIEPATRTTKDRICENSDAVRTIIEAIRDELGDNEYKLVAKLGPMDHSKHRAAVIALSDLVDGIAGINTLPVDVVDAHGRPIWSDRASRAGLSGFAIRSMARDFVERTALLREELDGAWDILGMGGVTSPDDFLQLYNLGADAVLAATGIYANPLLAQQCIEQLGQTISINAGVSTVFSPDRVQSRVLENLDSETDLVTLGKWSALPASVISENIPRLVEEGLVSLREDRNRGRLVRRV